MYSDAGKQKAKKVNLQVVSRRETRKQHPHEIMQMQKTAGNRAVLQMLLCK